MHCLVVLAAFFLASGFTPRLFGSNASPTSAGSSPGVLLANTQAGQQPPPLLSVWVYDYAGLSPASLRTAQYVASDIFARAGVRVRWLDHGPSDADALLPIRWPVASPVVVRIVTRDASRKSSPTTVGISVGCCLATLIYSRAVTYGNAMNVNPDVLLGCALAHELGHLLLGDRRHTSRGIMSSHWTSDDVSRLGLRQLTFSERQAQSIRTEVVLRYGVH